MADFYKQSNGYTYNYRIKNFWQLPSTYNVVSLNYSSISSNGAATSNSFRQSMLGSIGEAFERQSLIFDYNTNISADTWLKCFDLLTNKTVSIKKNNFINKYFYDTCGLATHTSTFHAAENAFREFIERQSFVLSYLSKKPKRVIKKNDYFNSIVPTKFRKFNFFEISIIDTYKVVLCYGTNNIDSINISLGAGYTIKQALLNVLDELQPLSKKHEPIKTEEGDARDYIHIFKDLSVRQIVSAYQYLNTNELYVPSDNEKISNRKEIIEQLFKIYGMRIYMCSLFSKNNRYYRNQYSKSIKIFSIGWFPSLLVSQFDEKIYSNVENRTGLSLDRRINFIPFP